MIKVMISDVNLHSVGSKLQPSFQVSCGPFSSPAQLSDVSTVADFCSELDLEDDEDNWDSDHGDSNTGFLSDVFPSISAFFDKRQALKDVPLSTTPQAKESLKEWSAIGERLASTLSGCEVESDEEDPPCSTPQVKKSLQGWSTVGQRLASTLSSCETDSDEDTDKEGLPISTVQVKTSLQGWDAVRQKLASTLSRCEVDSDEESPTSRMPQRKIKDSANGWSLVGGRLAHVFRQSAEEEDDFDWTPIPRRPN